MKKRGLTSCKEIVTLTDSLTFLSSILKFANMLQ